MAFLKKAKWAYLGISAIMLALGLVMVLWPTLSAQMLCVLLGTVLAISGIIKLVSYFSGDRFGLAFQFDFALGVFCVVAGVLMLLHPEHIVSALPVLLGVGILIDGVFKLQTALDAKRFGLERWGLVLLSALLTCAAGLLLLADPFSGAVALMVLQGVTLMVDGIQNLFVVAYTVRTEKKERL